MNRISRYSIILAIFLIITTSWACSLTPSSTLIPNATTEGLLPSQPNATYTVSSSQILDGSPLSLPSGTLFFSAVSISTPAPPSSQKNSQIYSLNFTDSRLSPLTSDDEHIGNFAVSKKDNRFAVVSESMDWGTPSIIILGEDGLKEKISDQKPAGMDWSPCGDKLALALDVNDTGDIFLVNSDGTGLTNLTNSPDQKDSNPIWSPNCKKIAFVSQYIPPHSVVYKDSYGTTINTINADGTNNQLLTEFPQHVGMQKVNSFFPAWSSDNHHIAFISNLNGTEQLYVIDAESRKISHPLTAQSNYSMQYLRQPLWSPDGKNILFSSGDSIYITDATGNLLSKVIDGSNLIAPTWSPDGQWIGFISQTPGGLGGIFIIRPNGKDLRLIKSLPDKDIVMLYWRSS